MSEFFEVRPGQPFLTGDDAGIVNDSAEAGVTNYLICDRTCFRVPVSVGLRREWNGSMVRPQSWEARHPLDIIRSRPHERSRGSPRPEVVDSFVTESLIWDDGEPISWDDGIDITAS